MSFLEPVASYVCAAPGCQNQALNHCAKCNVTYYCTRDCQVKHWPVHKPLCQRDIKPISASSNPLGERDIRPNSSPSQLSGESKKPISSSSNSTEGRIQQIRGSLKKSELSAYTRLHEAVYQWNEKEATSDYLKPLPESPEGELLSLMTFADEDDCGLALNDNFGTVPGVQIIQRSDCIAKDHRDDCANYVFGGTEWYDNNNSALKDSKLLGPSERAFDFLKGKGYAPTPNPQVGDIIAYSTAFMKGGMGISHYGIISRVEGQCIYVRSKWNNGHVFEHRFNFIPMLYGRHYTFLTLKKP